MQRRQLLLSETYIRRIREPLMRFQKTRVHATGQFKAQHVSRSQYPLSVYFSLLYLRSPQYSGGGGDLFNSPSRGKIFLIERFQKPSVSIRRIPGARVQCEIVSACIFFLFFFFNFHTPCISPPHAEMPGPGLLISSGAARGQLEESTSVVMNY